LKIYIENMKSKQEVDDKEAEVARAKREEEMGRL
jgi:hypothetical protein